MLQALPAVEDSAGGNRPPSYSDIRLLRSGGAMLNGRPVRRSVSGVAQRRWLVRLIAPGTGGTPGGARSAVERW